MSNEEKTRSVVERLPTRLPRPAWGDDMVARMRRASVLLWVAGWACAAGAVELDAQEQAGQLIYMKGESPSGARIVARIGMGGLELSGASIACGNCHGEDGRGRAEGGNRNALRLDREVDVLLRAG